MSKKVTKTFKKKKTKVNAKKRRTGNRKTKNNNKDNSFCFVAGTLVSTENGLVPIEDIKEGDLVWSQNPETGEVKLKRVAQLFINKSDTILKINVAGEIIEATEQHVLYIDNVGWIPANMTEEGDVVVLQSGEKAANKLGFIKSPYKAKNRERIYYNKKTKTYISQDIGSGDGTGPHNGGVWKQAKSPEELNSKKTRMGTYDANLNRIGD